MTSGIELAENIDCGESFTYDLSSESGIPLKKLVIDILLSFNKFSESAIEDLLFIKFERYTVEPYIIHNTTLVVDTQYCINWIISNMAAPTNFTISMGSNVENGESVFILKYFKMKYGKMKKTKTQNMNDYQILKFLIYILSKE